MERNKVTLLDGGMGTMLQKYGVETGRVPEVLNITEPETITKIHREYVEAGSDIIYTNTFGCNRIKAAGCGYTVPEMVDAAVKNARAACAENTKVAVSIGPLGQMLEPAGTMRFEQAYEAFKEVAVQAQASGADLIVIETMTDLYEMKAAVLACAENTDLEIMASMSFEESGRTFTGCSIEAMAVTLEGLGVSKIGINCSLGPVEILPLAKRLCAATRLPVFIKPNAGLPDPATGAYDITPREFIRAMEKYLELGISVIGGCCGTNPDHISGLAEMIGRARLARSSECACAALPEDAETAPEGAKTDVPSVRATRVCTPTNVVTADHIVVCGERLNPTGKKRLKQAIVEGDTNYILKQVVAQEEQGAEILDVNAGVPGVDEASVLPWLIKKIQSVTDLPLQIDSSDPAAIEAALRVYNGKPIVNSVNGEKASMEKILPLVKKYGAAVIALTLDEDGIPDSTEKRIQIAKKIVSQADKLGIPREDIIVDCLTLTASAQQEGVSQTLNAIRIVKEEMGLKTALGVSNISFGLPARPLVNRTFLTLAIQCGLDFPIIDPGDEDMMAAVATCEMLHARDKNAEHFIKKYSNFVSSGSRAGNNSPGDPGNSGSAGYRGAGSGVNDGGQAGTDADGRAGADAGGRLQYALEKGLEEETALITKELLCSEDEMTVVNDHLIPALDVIGKKFEAGTLFLPQMIQAATAAQSGFEVIKQSMNEKGADNISLGKVVIATVKGDVHDIGKNIVKVIMENYGFEMIDLGKDVPPETIVAAAVENNVKAVGLSALMTTTLKSMEETIAMLKEAKPDCKVLVGGAVLTEEYSKKIGADYYCSDAMKSVEAAKQIYG